MVISLPNFGLHLRIKSDPSHSARGKKFQKSGSRSTSDWTDNADMMSLSEGVGPLDNGDARILLGGFQGIGRLLAVVGDGDRSPRSE